MGYFNDEFTKRKMDIKEGFDFRHVAHQELPDYHPDNFDPQGVNRWPEGDQEFRCAGLRVQGWMCLGFRVGGAWGF